MSHFGILSSFDHNVTDWKTYKSRLTQWLIANDINAKSDESGVKRRAILLSALTDGTYKLTADLALPKELQDLPYADILQLLDKHFTPKTCGFSERFRFYAASQQQGETYPQWAARLRGLTAHCGFNDVEEALRDRFVMGMIAGPEREKLFAQEIKDLTLAKAVEMAESIRCARTAATTGPSSSFQPDPVFKIAHKGRDNSATVRSGIKCSVCGRSNHKSSQCRFANYKCNKCNEKGHLRKMCTKVKYVTAEAEGVSEDDDDGKFFYIRSMRGEPMVELISINQTSYKFEIDSGSAVTVISEQFYKSNFKDVPLSTARKRLMTYTGRHIECVGVARLPVSYLQQTHDLDIHVVRDGGPPLLGRDFISSKLQQQYSLLFSDKLGTFKKYKIKLLMQDNAKPIFFKARPIAFALRDKVEKEIDRLVTLGVLKPVEYSEYASPVVPVLKRNGSVRLCADYSVSLNKQLLVEKYPLPTVNELFSKLHGARVFSKIDLSMAYNQCVLDDESQALTCINTHRGLYKYTRLVFGLASAPAIFQRVMENVLSGLEGVLCMLDDVCIFSFDKKTHFNRLNAVFKRLEDSGFTLQKEKCDFFKDEIGYLGHIISKDGIKKAPEKVKAMTDAPIPSNVSQLQSFLGLVNYYRNFVPNASSVLSPLYDLLKKGCKWNWTQEHDLAFQTIKSLLTSEQTLAHFNPNAKIILTVDASPSGLGAILSQVDADGVERPISFASRTLNPAEKRYAQIQKEIKLNLLRYLMDYRNSVHTTTGLSPAEMVFGHKLRSRLDLIDPKPSSPSSPPTVYNRVLNKQCSQSKFNGCNKTTRFSKNDNVLFKKFINKNNYKWCKGTIMKRLGNVTYTVKDSNSSECFKRHKNQLVLDKGVRNNIVIGTNNTDLPGPGPSSEYPPPPQSPPQPQSPPPQSPPPQSPSHQSPSPLQTPPPPQTLFQRQPPVLGSESPTVTTHSELDYSPDSGLARGRRAEFYVPATSSLLEESVRDGSSVDKPGVPDVIVDNAIATDSDPDEEFQEAVDFNRNQRDVRVEEQDSSRLLRNRPRVDYKKFF
ncbi:hypothetical protein ABMA28_010384 [Loxostege sticticalis]|uniref:Reverse transcriptase domain-containing protein n=1 Tax=Loxostege sticticalis TaxID=481309 RepID=A0ABD0SCQ9_LOXSC